MTGEDAGTRSDGGAALGDIEAEAKKFPWMRGAPLGFSTAIFRMSARTSRGRGGRQDRLPRRDSQFQ
jgi:hypothetical protein